MNLGDKDEVYAECEKLGEEGVRAYIEANAFGSGSVYPRQWLLEKIEERRLQREAEERARNERALIAAEKSAAASEQAALSARSSARWTMVAAIAALLSIIIHNLLK